MSTQKFRDELEAFLKETGYSPTNLGKLAVGDPNLVRQVLREGRVPNLDIVEAVYEQMAAVRLLEKKKARAST